MASTLKITWSGFGPWGVGQVIVGDARCATGRPRTPVLMLTMSGHAVPNDLRLSCAYGGRSTRGALRGRARRSPAAPVVGAGRTPVAEEVLGQFLGGLTARRTERVAGPATRSRSSGCSQTLPRAHPDRKSTRLN